MKIYRPMKKILLSATGIILFSATVVALIVSCNKEESIVKDPNNHEYSSIALSSIDFSAYYQEAEAMSAKFWAACDIAYQNHPKEFMKACKENDFEAFQRITCIGPTFFEQFRNTLLKAQMDIEADHPGIIECLSESPCTSCSKEALTRIGHVVDTLQGNSATYTEKMGNSDCWFVCSLSCMATMELYVPCVLACVKICKKYMRDW